METAIINVPDDNER